MLAFVASFATGCAAPTSGGGAALGPASAAQAAEGDETATAEHDDRWGVLVARFSAADHRRRAAQQAQRLRPSFPDLPVRVADDGDRSVVLVGSFDGPGDPAADRALQTVKSFSINGRRPFARAFLARPRIDPRGNTPELSLVEAAEQSRGEAEYTLQVEQYDSEDRRARARAAEQRARELRNRGEEAYYLHGPRFSVVTIGLWGADAFDERLGRVTDPALRRAQERFPYMLLNGARYRFRGASEDVATILIRVPE
jgi:hypothetical protein